MAVKIILKRNVKGNEQMVYDELEMLQKLKHPHIVKFVDWFESRVSSPPLPSPPLRCAATLGTYPSFTHIKLTHLCFAGQVLYRHTARDRR